MFAFIEGLLDYIDEETCVVDAGGFGININISGRTAMMLPGIGEHVKLYTYTAVREDSISLYGFDTREDLNLYKKLITVNGVGPKVGLALLSALDADAIRLAIISEDFKKISSAPGVGPKTAQRIVLELKDKIKMSDDALVNSIVNSKSLDIVTSNDKSTTDEMKDAISALVALGYGQTDSRKAVLSIENVEKMDSSEILSAALKKLF
ncbi:MAG: Holliday junction branch migration protein RuvA [Lachnospiraceae bacterium]|nr:Holliday junction branch migration protein RuvA [Lachnospiraceae bacterium]